MSLESALQRLISESQIRTLLNKYPRALDRQDHDLLTSIFHLGAIDDHGVFNGLASEYVEFMRAQEKEGQHWFHHNGTQVISFPEDSPGDDWEVAECETYTLAFCRMGRKGENGYGREIFLRVRYLDRVEKKDGVWKIAHRRVVYGPCHIAKIEQEFELGPECIEEAGFGKDGVYKF